MRPEETDRRSKPAPTLADKLIEIHTWFRSELDHIRAEAARYFAEREAAGAPTAPGLGLQLRQRCLEFCQVVEFHHTAEDAHVFPMVAGLDPGLRGPIDRLAEEHVSIARLKAELVALLADIEEADPAEFTARLERINAELAAHLAYEEEQLLPALAAVSLG